MDDTLAAVKSLQSICRIFLVDLQALPEEAFTQHFGGKTRTVADIVFEVNLVNDHIGMVLRGEEPFAWPEGGWITAPERFDTKAVVIAAFEASSKKILETAEAMTAEDLASTVQTERGETTRAERLRFMAFHMGYHSGQLNFMQALLGDDAWHW